MKITKHWFLSFTIFVMFIIVLPICIGYSIYNKKEKGIQIYNYFLKESDYTYDRKIGDIYEYSLYNVNNWKYIRWEKVLWLYANSWIIYLYNLDKYLKIYEDEIIELDINNLTLIEKNIFDTISKIPDECFSWLESKEMELKEQKNMYYCFKRNPNIIID